MSGEVPVVTTTEHRALPTRGEVLAELASANYQAKRQQCIVRVPNDAPSKWDEWHEWVDLLLDDLRVVPD